MRRGEDALQERLRLSWVVPDEFLSENFICSKTSFWNSRVSISTSTDTDVDVQHESCHKYLSKHFNASREELPGRRVVLGVFGDERRQVVEDADRHLHRSSTLFCVTAILHKLHQGPEEQDSSFCSQFSNFPKQMACVFTDVVS